MPTVSKLLIFCTLLAPTLGWSFSRETAVEDYLQTWSLNVGGSFTSTVMSHNEVAFDGAYLPIREAIRIPEGGFSLKLTKEFFVRDRISYTFTAFGGKVDGSYESGPENNSVFNEDSSTSQFGGGISANYNFFVYGLKMQPFVGVNLAMTNSQYTLSHRNGANRLMTIHDVSQQLAVIGTGVRFFDSETGLMSYLSIETPQTMSEEVQTTSTINGENTIITTPATIQRAPLIFSLGFGAYF